MEDLKVIIYILLGVAFFIYNAWRKAFKDTDKEINSKDIQESEPRTNQPLPQAQRPNTPSTSFEDILRELQPKVERAKEQGKAVVATAKEKVEPVLEQKKQPFSSEQPVRKPISLEDSLTKGRREPVLKEVQKNGLELYRQQYTGRYQSKYAEMLKSPGGLRDAVILSEIFNRKYS